MSSARQAESGLLLADILDARKGSQGTLHGPDWPGSGLAGGSWRDALTGQRHLTPNPNHHDGKPIRQLGCENFFSDS